MFRKLAGDAKWASTEEARLRKLLDNKSTTKVGSARGGARGGSGRGKPNK